MAPAVGSTEMRYCGISLFSRLARTTSALWPAEPTGGVPQRMSFACDQAAELVKPINDKTAKAANTRFNVDGLSMTISSLTVERRGAFGFPSPRLRFVSTDETCGQLLLPSYAKASYGFFNREFLAP